MLHSPTCDLTNCTLLSSADIVWVTLRSTLLQVFSSKGEYFVLNNTLLCSCPGGNIRGMANLSPVTGHVFESFWRYLWALAVWIGIGFLDR